jgi:hypothetical protein
LFNILCYQNRIHKIFLFLMSSYVYSLFSFLSQNQTRELRYSHILLNAPLTPLLPVIHTVLFQFLNLFYPITLSKERCGDKRVSSPSQNRNPGLCLTRQFALQYLGWVILMIKRSLFKTLNCLRTLTNLISMDK